MRLFLRFRPQSRRQETAAEVRFAGRWRINRYFVSASDTNGRFFRCGLSVAVILAALAIHHSASASIPAPYEAGSIYTINLAGGSYDGLDLSARMQCHANAIKSAALSLGIEWDFIATQESSETLSCPFTSGPMINAAACLGEGLRGARSILVHAYGYDIPLDGKDRDSGLIINTDNFDVLNTYSRGIGNWGGIAAARVRNKGTGAKVLVSSVHIRTNAAYYCEREGDIDELMSALSDWAQAGDAAPIVAGDFNCNDDSPWGTDPDWTGCPDIPLFRDVFFSGTWNDQKLCRYIARYFSNESNTFQDMVLSQSDQSLFAPSIGGGSADASWNGVLCSDHDMSYANFVIGCSCPNGSYCAGSFWGGRCESCPSCNGRCGTNCGGNSCTCPSGQQCIQNSCVTPSPKGCTVGSQCTAKCRCRAPAVCHGECVDGTCVCQAD